MRSGRRIEGDEGDNARDFFLKRGFEAYRRNTIPIGNEWIANTTMKKILGAKERAKGAAQ